MKAVVSRFSRMLWSMLYFYKYLLIGGVLLYSNTILSLEPNDLGLNFNDGIKAPFFALASAATLFVSLLPKNPRDVNDIVAEFLIRVVGASTACLAGWFWLSGAVNGDALRYVIELWPVFLLIGLFVVLPIFGSILMSFVIAMKTKDTSESGPGL